MIRVKLVRPPPLHRSHPVKVEVRPIRMVWIVICVVLVVSGHDTIGGLLATFDLDLRG